MKGSVLKRTPDFPEWVLLVPEFDALCLAISGLLVSRLETLAMGTSGEGISCLGMLLPKLFNGKLKY